MTTAPRHVSPGEHAEQPETQPRRAAGATGCPGRLLVPSNERTGPALEPPSGATDGRWVVRSFDLARQVMRDSDSVRQAGFGADRINRAEGRMRPPVLYLEGAPHRVQRKAAARFFAPKVTEDYREMMESLSARLVSRLRTDVAVDLGQLSLEMAVQVAARVVGLTNSSLSGMTRRLDSFFEHDSTGPARGPWGRLKQLLNQTTLLRFFYLDVKPAIRARRRRRSEDVISQLIDQGFNDFDILTECVTYGAAGMVTTREFITVAVWHLLDDPDLLARYRAAEMAERLEILNETLRLEPVVGHLYRRSTATITLSTAAGEVEVGVGALIDLDIRAINADAGTVGEQPLELCPARDLPRSVPPTLMSFGDGNHKCPGASIAIMETEIFVTTLLRHDVVAAGPPNVRWNSVTQGYDLDGFMITLRR